MAARRPPSRAAGSSSNAALPRSRSALARMSTATTTGPAPTVPTTKYFPKPPGEEVETNIRVVVRCRRRSSQEIEDKSPIIVTSSGAKSQQISVEVSTPTSTLGVVTLAPTREYPFDLVFGPEADQSMIYHEVVQPMLDQVLTGYNCTLFAYGQTGTGKTYTMQGDLVPTPMGNPSQGAGMVPRVLFRLFHHLETSGADYCVKISFVELYNEELRDLLAADFQPPSSNSQPMGKDQQNVTNLKIFDDANKRGVFIQGLEEIAVKDSTHALALLTKGSERRQIAATKLNDHSSRSHSIFSITVHTKETSTAGEDLLKIGKLNLVDLAGSENIGRSGAVNNRAREAGMINQSLLTLGRVINALVDKSQHVPYRESKLTRLLQDSLGGRTKTCIIATVSPARSNLEETLSTLDYAMHAKSIRNKPELNQRMTRNSLLKEYVSEIERLKADLLAAREKNGVFFSEETWKQMTAEQELKQTELEETKKQVDIVESQMRAVREEFEQSIGLLMKREKELEQTKGQLKATQEIVEDKEKELGIISTALEDETVVRKAYQESEARLDAVASDLRQVAKDSVRDVGGLFDKLERKTTTFETTNKLVLAQTRGIAKNAITFNQRVTELSKKSTQHSQTILNTTRTFQSREIESLSAQSTRIDEQLKRIQEALSIIRSKETIESEAVHSVKDVMEKTHETLQNEFGKWGEGLGKSCQEMGAAVNKSGASGLNSLENTVSEIGKLTEGLVKEARLWADGLRESMKKMQDDAEKASSEEVSRLKRQNETLLGLLASERERAERGKDDLIQRISGMLGDFVKERDDGLRQAVGELQADNKGGMKQVQTMASTASENMAQITLRNEKMLEEISSRGAQAKRTWDGAVKTSTKSKEEFSKRISHMQSSIGGSIENYTAQIQKQGADMATSCSEAFTRHDRAKRQRTESTNGVMTEVQSDYRSFQRSVASTSRNIESLSSTIQSENQALSTNTTNFIKSASTHTESLQESTKVILDRASQEDSPIGTTPKKRVWHVVEHWEMAGKRDQILRNAREAQFTSITESSGLSIAMEPEVDEKESVGEGESQPQDSPRECEPLMSSPEIVDPGPLPEVIPEPVLPPETTYPDFSPTSSGSSLGTIPIPVNARTRLRKPTNAESHLPVKPTVHQPLVESRTTNAVQTRASRRLTRR